MINDKPRAGTTSVEIKTVRVKRVILCSPRGNNLVAGTFPGAGLLGCVF
jgi:hypothetical protein